MWVGSLWLAVLEDKVTQLLPIFPLGSGIIVFYFNPVRNDSALNVEGVCLHLHWEEDQQLLSFAGGVFLQLGMWKTTYFNYQLVSGLSEPLVDWFV